MTSTGARPAARVAAPGADLGRRRRVAAVIVIADAGVAALLFGLWLGGDWPGDRLVALAGAGSVTAWSLPVVRLVVQVCAVGTVGALITAILLPRTEGELCVAARRSLRSATWLALSWGAATAAMLALTWSDETAVPVTELPFSQLLNGTAAGSFQEAIPYLFGALLSLLISVGAASAQSVQGAIGLLVLSGYNLLPLSTQGHATHNAVTPYAVTVHVVAVSLWAGGLAGLIIHVRGHPDLLAVAVPRFSRLALVCYIAVGASGVTAALLLLGSPSQLWSSRYGLLVWCKVAALATLGYVGWRHRRRTVPALARKRSRRAFVRLAAVEAGLMTVTIALGVALSDAPTPDETVRGQHSHAAPAATPGGAGPARTTANNVGIGR